MLRFDTRKDDDGNMIFSNKSEWLLQPLVQRRMKCILLAFMWLSGLICGSLFAIKHDQSLESLMHAAFSGSVSIVGMLIVVFWPYLFSAFAVFYSVPKLVFLFAFTETFSFGYCIWGVCTVYGEAGWLVRWLLFFTACCSSPMLYWFLQRCICAGKQHIFRDLLICCMVLVVIVSLDYCVISPFAATLISS